MVFAEIREPPAYRIVEIALMVYSVCPTMAIPRQEHVDVPLTVLVLHQIVNPHSMKLASKGIAEVQHAMLTLIVVMMVLLSA